MGVLTKVLESKANQKMLFDALLVYDLKRLAIVEVIPDIIAAYNVVGPLQQSLMKYGEAFQQIYADYHPKLETLQDYKAYDFRVGMSYASMLATIMSTDHDFYQRLQRDMEDETTSIGGYVQSLSQSYSNVEKVNAEIREFHLVRQIDKELGRINQEIEQR